MTINEYVEMKKHKWGQNDIHNPSCGPPSGKTYLTIGQDLFSIQEYMTSQYNHSLHQGSTKPMSTFQPAATMFYTDIQTLRGLDVPVDYGSGIEYADGLAQQQAMSMIGSDKILDKDSEGDGGGGTGIQIGLWLNGTAGCQDIVNGHLHNNMHKLFKYLKHVPVTKVFLRVGYEFDNPSFGYSGNPALYRKAYREFVKTCEKQLGTKKCHAKIAFVWHSWAAPIAVNDITEFYPGNRYVDWVGISIFQQLYPWAHDNDQGEFAGGTMSQVRDVLDFAKQLNKPIMISESTPFGGIDLLQKQKQRIVEGSNVTSPIQDYLLRSNSTNSDEDMWDVWFQPTLDLIEKYDIGMWSYISCDWESQPMWNGVGFGNTLLSSSSPIMKKWQRHVIQNPRFMNRLACSSGHTVRGSSSSSSSSRLSLGMIWDDEGQQLLKNPWFLCIVLAIAAGIVVIIIKWACKVWKNRQREEIGYFEIDEETEKEEEQGLGEIQKLFGSSSRLNVEAEELSFRQSASTRTRSGGIGSSTSSKRSSARGSHRSNGSSMRSSGRSSSN